MARIEPWSKKHRCSIISEHVFSTDFIEAFQKHWCSSSDFKDANFEIISKPFKICKISNFLNDEIMEEVKNELLDIKYRRKIIDLYQLEQTGDLGTVTNKHIKMLYKVFQEDMTSWMELNTKVTLNGTVSMSSSCYYDTDYLLCHDDNMNDRKIAFILYLMKEWSIKDGGALELFDTDEYDLPKNVVKSLVPEYNSLIFFEVMDNSYHQVTEITSPEICRWSISGWFHGPIKIRNEPLRPVLSRFIEPTNTDVELNSWFSEKYLSPSMINNIQFEVEKSSYVYLDNFLKPDVYEKILADLKTQDIRWQMLGPADERHYEIADEQTLPQLLKDFYDIFKSITFSQLLKGYTELDLVPKDGPMKPKMTIELQRWSTGCYTLIIDRMVMTEFPVESAHSTRKLVISQLDQLDKNDKEDTTVPDESFCDTKYSKEQSDNIDEMSNPESEHAVFTNREDDELADNEIYEPTTLRSLKRKMSSSPQPSSSKSEINSKKLGRVEDNYLRRSSDSSDIEDYMSHTDSDSNEESISDSCPKSLDLIMQFHIASAKDIDDTIDYVDPREPNGELIHIPTKENHLCLVYKATNICRLHRYINHYCKGYFYNLICTYYEE